MRPRPILRQSRLQSARHSPLRPNPHPRSRSSPSSVSFQRRHERIAARNSWPPAPSARPRSTPGPSPTSSPKPRTSANPSGPSPPSPPTCSRPPCRDHRPRRPQDDHQRPQLPAPRFFMADFEDSTTPTWDNLLDGQLNLRDIAVRRAPSPSMKTPPPKRVTN